MAKKNQAGVAIALGLIVGAIAFAGGRKKSKGGGGTTPDIKGDDEGPMCAVGQICPPGQVCKGGVCVEDDEAQKDPERPSAPPEKIPSGAPPEKTPGGAIVSPDCSSVSFEDGVGDTFFNVLSGEYGGNDVIAQAIEQGYQQPMDIVEYVLRAAINNDVIQINCFTASSFPPGNSGDRLSIERQRLRFMKQYPQVYNWFASLADRIDQQYLGGEFWISTNQGYRITRTGSRWTETIEPIIEAAVGMVQQGELPALAPISSNDVRRLAVPDNFPETWNIQSKSREQYVTLNAGGGALDALQPGLGALYIGRTFQETSGGDIVFRAADNKFTGKTGPNTPVFAEVAMTAYVAQL